MFQNPTDFRHQLKQWVIILVRLIQRSNPSFQYGSAGDYADWWVVLQPSWVQNRIVIMLAYGHEVATDDDEYVRVAEGTNAVRRSRLELTHLGFHSGK